MAAARAKTKIETKMAKMAKTSEGAQRDELAPWDKAGVLAKYSLSFVLPLIKLAWRKQLDPHLLPKLPRGDKSRTLGERLERNYRLERERAARRRRPKSTSGHARAEVGPKAARQEELCALDERAAGSSLVRALFRTFGLELVLANLFNTFVRLFLLPLQTITLGWLLADIRRYANLRLIEDVFVEPALGSNDDDCAPGANWTALNNSTLLYTSDLNNTQQLAAAAAEAANELERGVIKQRILIYLSALVTTTCLASCLLHPFYFKTYHLGMKCRVAACHLIYKKALRLSQQALGAATAGQMINLLSNDVNRFDRVAESIPFLVDGPIQVALISFLLSKYYLGLWPTLAGLLVVLAFVLLQGLNGRLFGRFRLRAARRTDERVRLMSELLQAIKVVKMYAWEGAFWARAMRARKREMRQLQHTLLVRAINQTLFFMSSKLIVFAMLMAYAALDAGPLDPELVFVTIGLSNLIRITISMYLANAIAQCAETLVSCERIGRFLQLPELRHCSPNELSPTRQHHISGSHQAACATMQDGSCDNDDEASDTSKSVKSLAIKLERAYAWWRSKEHMVLRNLSVEIETNQLVMLVGRVGAGKSSTLLTILGELELASGRLELWGRVSYAPQEPWLFAGTVRENILMGEQLDLARYEEVVRVCCLERDFKQLLKAGDQTQVGERGSALSGGQRARVSLARALYKRAQIYLLDDPLAALDAPVARHIARACFARPAGFLARATVLLATHQLQLLHLAERVLLLDQQAPALFGTPAQLLASPKFALIDYGRQAFEEAVSRRCSEVPHLDSDFESAALESVALEAPALKTTPAPPSGHEEDENNVEKAEEDGEVASNGGTYLYYLHNLFTPAALIGFLLVVVLAQALYLWIDFLLARWTEAREQLETLGEQIYQPQGAIDAWTLGEMAQFYALSIASGLLAVLLLCLGHARASLRASKRMHAHLLERLLAAPLNQLERTPIGRLLNRVSRDLGFVDQTLPLAALDIVLILSNILALLLLTILLNPYNSLVALGLLALALVLRALALRAITRLKQLEGAARSPVFSHLSASLNGLATIRAFQLERAFCAQFDARQDAHSSAWFAFVCTTRWLGQATDWASLAFVALVLIGAIVFQLDAATARSASLIGLLLSHAVYMPGALQAAMRQLVEAESQLTSVQRLKELCEWPREPDGEESGASLASFNGERNQRQAAATAQLAACPAGCIKFVNVTLRYNSSGARGQKQNEEQNQNQNQNEKPPQSSASLAGLSLLIRPRERVGVIGRTGAGKSSLLAVLFRLHPFEGRVELDGRDTRALSLRVLRNCISIIPQEPALFAGSLRYNLDPFERASDFELWRALEAVQLAGGGGQAASTANSSSSSSGSPMLFGRHAPEGLEFQVGEAGVNLSAGQRQLICLARALVRQSKLLVLDEATASVDVETEALIQLTIRRHFAHCTVITIAHRLATVVHCDRVLVLDAGRLRQFDAPRALLRDPEGLFAQMLASAGAQQAAHLRKLIEQPE